MSIPYIRSAYGVPAKVGGRILYTGGSHPKLGTITGASGGHISIRLDGEKRANPFHPTWKLEYLPDTSNAGRDGGG